MRRLISSALVLLCFVYFAPPALAGPITIDFTARVTSTIDYGGHPGSVVRDLAALPDSLRALRLDRVVTPAEPSGLHRLKVSSQVAHSAGQRARLVVEYLDQIEGARRVRERALFSSFSLPPGGPYDPSWDRMRRPGLADADVRELLSCQRCRLEAHARAAGCSLVLSPTTAGDPEEAAGHRERIGHLLAFLRSMPAALVTVAFADAGMPGNLLLVGDWMCAAAPPPQPGDEYLGSFGTCHAPTVLRWVRHFDADLSSKLRVPHEASRDAAIERLQSLLDRLQPGG